MSTFKFEHMESTYAFVFIFNFYLCDSSNSKVTFRVFVNFSKRSCTIVITSLRFSDTRLYHSFFLARIRTFELLADNFTRNYIFHSIRKFFSIKIIKLIRNKNQNVQLKSQKKFKNYKKELN